MPGTWILSTLDHRSPFKTVSWNVGFQRLCSRLPDPTSNPTPNIRGVGILFEDLCFYAANQNLTNTNRMVISSCFLWKTVSSVHNPCDILCNWLVDRDPF